MLSRYVDYTRLKEANRKALKGLWNMLPLLLGVLLLVSMMTVLVPRSAYGILFNGNLLWDSIMGSLLGSILTGNPVTSYIIGAGFLDNGISIIAVTSFIAAWTTVGFVQLPVESMVLGKRFALARNVSAFLMSIIVGMVTALIIGVL
ncbi:MAG: hypothetical protein GXP63_03055 [DPANN group archaeon]|nr:hypothetical protein [DPANN group archaeon]